MSPTLLPFLYQTRTLERLVRSPSSRQALRSLHVSTRLHKRTSFRDSTRSKSRGSSDPIPFILPDEMQPKPSAPDADQPKLDTITPAERLAFERAFEEIAARRPPPMESLEPAMDLEQIPEEEAEPSSSSSENEDTAWQGPSLTSDPRMNLNIIMADAAANNMGKRPPIKGLSNLHPLQSLKVTQDPSKGLLRFPPSLRNAAKIALGIYDEQSTEPLPKPPHKEAKDSDTKPTMSALLRQAEKGREASDEAMHASVQDELSQTFENERLRQVERKRIEEKMRACATDVELWQVIEDEVFPLLGRLGIDAEQPGGQPVKKKGKKSKAAKPELEMEVYGPVYPMLLVTSLRLLDRQFSQPSQLALSILPRIKELGVASYVLGVSTAFYNNLLAIYWRRYGDMSSVLAHLEEMRHAGLFFDSSTSTTISQMSTWLNEMSHGDHGAFLQAAMSMPEYEVALRQRLKHWSKEITRSIAERKRDLGY